MAEAQNSEFPGASDALNGSGSGPGSGSRTAAKTYQLSSMGLSVDSCLSAGELCEGDERPLAAMSDSVYSAVSDVTLVGGCQCPEGSPCHCGAREGTGEEGSSSTDSGTSLRGCARSKDSTTPESSPPEEEVCGAESGNFNVDRIVEMGHENTRGKQIGSPGIDDGSEESKPPVVTASVYSALSAAGAMESAESAPLASSGDLKPSPVVPAGSGDATLHVPGPDRRRLSLDSSGILAAVFRQNEQFQQLTDVEDDRPRSFTFASEARQSQSRSTSASESQSETTGGGEDSSQPGTDLEEALYQFRHQRLDSLASSEPSDVSVQELELETTGDFPHDFQFPDAGGSSRRPSAVWPDEAEAEERLAGRTGSGDRLQVRPQLSRTLSDQTGREIESTVSESGGLPVPVVVVDPAEESSAAAPAAVPPASRSPPVRRGFLARLVDSTAAFLLGGLQDDGGDRRHRSYTVSASDYRPASAAAAAAARRAAAAVGGDRTSFSCSDPASASSVSVSAADPASPRSSLAPPSEEPGRVESPAALCRQCREPGCSPEVACLPSLARRRSVHSDDRPISQDREQHGELLVPARPPGGGGGAAEAGRSQTAEDVTDERRKLRQQSMQNELRVKVTYHNVKPGETIPSIAAFYECLPGELKELNRLQFKKNILPGQVLRILDRRRVQESPKPPEGGGDGSQDSGDGGVSHKPADPSSPGLQDPAPDDVRSKQYIQIRRTRLFTESEGVAVGSLMITPNCVMFRPNVSDPLVVERGEEYYTADIPLRHLVTAEYYTEPPHNSPAAESQHREAHRESFHTPAPDNSPSSASHQSREDGTAFAPAEPDGAHVTPPPARTKRPCSPDSDSAEGPNEATTAALGDSKPSPPQPTKTDTSSSPSGSETGPAPASSPSHRSQSPPAATGEAKRRAFSRGGGRASFSAPPPLQDGEEELGSPLSEVIPIVSSAPSVSDSSERSFPLSASLRSQESISAGSPTPGATAPQEIPSGKQQNNGTKRNKRSGSRKSSCSSISSLKNETPLDEKPSLFKAADELLRVHTPVVSQPPLYLELVTGKARGRLLPRSERARVMFCGQRRIPSRLLFAVPRESCEQLYRFLRRWAPALCDDLDLVDKLERQDFEQIDSDDDIWEPEALEGEWQDASDSREVSAPTVDAAEGPSQPPPPSPLDTAFLPELIGRTELLTDETRVGLQRHLPARVEGHPWQMVFNSAEHGFSLKTLYRQAVEFDCPMLLVVQDSSQAVFGAVCTDPIRFGKHFYGTGESFLFTLRPEFRVFRWSGENQYFARGSVDCLEFGSGDGRSGLFLDEGLLRGFTESCQTYNNDLLTATKDFSITAVEVWALG